MKKRLYVVEDHPIVRRGLIMLLQSVPGIEVVGEAEDVESALSGVEETDPDLVLVDVSLRNSSGIDLIRSLSARRPGLPTLAVSGHDVKLYGDAARTAGARAYVMKSEGPDRILTAVREILDGEG
jgi:DNA-binding NarL/FixJ family response regulator